MVELRGAYSDSRHPLAVRRDKAMCFGCKKWTLICSLTPEGNRKYKWRDFYRHVFLRCKALARHDLLEMAECLGVGYKIWSDGLDEKERNKLGLRLNPNVQAMLR